MKSERRQTGSDRFVKRMTWFASLFLRRPCIACGSGVSMNRLAKTGYGKKDKEPWIHCYSCKAKLRLSRKHLYTKFWLVVGPVFILSAGLGAEIFAQFEVTNIYREHRDAYEANGLGFILTILLFVIPLTSVAQRVFKIEVIE